MDSLSALLLEPKILSSLQIVPFSTLHAIAVDSLSTVTLRSPCSDLRSMRSHSLPSIPLVPPVSARFVTQFNITCIEIRFNLTIGTKVLGFILCSWKMCSYLYPFVSVKWEVQNRDFGMSNSCYTIDCFEITIRLLILGSKGLECASLSNYWFVWCYFVISRCFKGIYGSIRWYKIRCKISANYGCRQQSYRDKFHPCNWIKLILTTYIFIFL